MLYLSFQLYAEAEKDWRLRRLKTITLPGITFSLLTCRKEVLMMKNMMEKAHILLVDEDMAYRHALRQILEHEEDMEVVGDCTSAEEALSQMSILSPNIVLMDTNLPGMDGIEACRCLSWSRQACQVIMLTSHSGLIDYALKAGAVGYYPKKIGQSELLNAVRLACKWQLLSAKRGAGVYSVHHIEAMILENLSQFTAGNADDHPVPDWLSSTADNPDAVKTVTLALPPFDDAFCLQRFIGCVMDTFQAKHIKTVGSWSGTHLTFELKSPVSLANIIDELLKMPDIAEVECCLQTPVGSGYSGPPQEDEAALESKISVTFGRHKPSSLDSEIADQYLDLPELQLQPLEVMVN